MQATLNVFLLRGIKMLCIQNVGNKLLFGGILPGEVFNFESDFYLKTRQIDLLDDAYNCVLLDNGSPTYFCDDELVTEVSGAFVVGYKQEK